jgi:hypothetical protein
MYLHEGFKGQYQHKWHIRGSIQHDLSKNTIDRELLNHLKIETNLSAAAVHGQEGWEAAT